MLIAVGSVKGSPGATTVAVGLAASWPSGGAVLVEVDAEGGDLAARFGHCPQRGLTSLAASARAGARTQPLGWHTQRLGLGVDVVLAPPGNAAAAVHTVACSARALLADAGTAVVCDVGRLTLGSPAAPIAAVADHLLLVTRPAREDLCHVDARIGWLRDEVAAGRLTVVLAGRGDYGPADVALAWGVRVAGQLPHDRWGAGVLAGRLYSRGWRRLRLPRAIAGIPTALAHISFAPTAATPAARQGAATVTPSVSPSPAGDRVGAVRTQ